MSRVLATILACLACTRGSPQPVPDPREGSCAYCKMPMADPRLAGKVVIPGEEPLLFDDIGCLRDWRKSRQAAPGAKAFVADHRTGKWVPAESAVYVRTTKLWTPMGSQLIAYEDAASRDADPAASGGAPVTPAEALEGGR